jgi:hypothetical protein
LYTAEPLFKEPVNSKGFHMKKNSMLISTIVLFILGCSNDGSPAAVPLTDNHPTSILSFYSNGLSFDTEKAFAIVSIGDTVWHEITAFDNDRLVSYTIIHVNKNVGLITPLESNDTLIARFGFIADTSVVKPNKVVLQSIIFTDALGFAKKIDIELYIKP